ncbi:hypothetical protein [Methylobacterium sp. ID0610]|uniref:hypothetical protein n=1 Tax=Methylobacterium carpenticola TaxID=3344827 RepID=UPI00369DD203
MCFGCFKDMRDEFGAVEITPAIVEAARLSQEANHYGPLHVTIEDYNCGDSSVAFCAAQKRDKWTDADRACLAAFQALNENERTHALALADGYIDASGSVTEAWREWDVPAEGEA